MAPSTAVMKSKILVIGGTGWIGKFIVEASANAGHPTFALVRDSTISNPTKLPLIRTFQNLGVNLILGDIHDHQSLVKAIKQVDVVISAVSYLHLPDQYKIISAIKDAGNIKRFFPSEFGNDVDHAHGVDEAFNLFDNKVKIRRTIEAEGIPHTYVAANFFSGHFLPTLSELIIGTPIPTNKVVILADGNPKAVFNAEEDVATYTIQAVDDPRTLNKIMYVRPQKNTLSFNEVVSFWEKKTGKTLERVYIPEKQVLEIIQKSPFPFNMGLSVAHSAFVREDHTNFKIDPSFGVEASELYPDVKFTAVEEFLYKKDCTPFYLNQFILLNNE